MAKKPEKYEGKDGVKIKCVKDYTVKAGTGKEADDVEYKEGQTYVMSPRSAAHMLRKLYNLREKDATGKLTYVGDANFFVDEAAQAAQAAAEKAAAKPEPEPKLG